jgi:excisionase family DNA binding protein
VENDIEKVCFNTKEAAKYLGLGITKTQEYIRAGIIPSIHIGRRYLIPKAVLDEWIKKSINKKIM